MKTSVCSAGLSLLFVACGATPSLASEPSCPEFQAEGALVVETSPLVLDNFRLPELTWPACPGATGYQIYLNNLFLAEVDGTSTSYRPRFELAFGSYTARVDAVFAEQEAIPSAAVPFRIGLGPPTQLSVDRICFESSPSLLRFSWMGVTLAQGYTVRVFGPGLDDEGLEVCDFRLAEPEGSSHLPRWHGCHASPLIAWQDGAEYTYLAIPHFILDVRFSPVPSERYRFTPSELACE